MLRKTSGWIFDITYGPRGEGDQRKLVFDALPSAYDLWECLQRLFSYEFPNFLGNVDDRLLVSTIATGLPIKWEDDYCFGRIEIQPVSVVTQVPDRFHSLKVELQEIGVSITHILDLDHYNPQDTDESDLLNLVQLWYDSFESGHIPHGLGLLSPKDVLGLSGARYLYKAFQEPNKVYKVHETFTDAGAEAGLLAKVRIPAKTFADPPFGVLKYETVGIYAPSMEALFWDIKVLSSYLRFRQNTQ